MTGRNLIVNSPKSISEHDAKIRLKISFRYREIVKKTENILLSYDVNDQVYSKLIFI